MGRKMNRKDMVAFIEAQVGMFNTIGELLYKKPVVALNPEAAKLGRDIIEPLYELMLDTCDYIGELDYTYSYVTKPEQWITQRNLEYTDTPSWDTFRELYKLVNKCWSKNRIRAEIRKVNRHVDRA